MKKRLVIECILAVDRSESSSAHSVCKFRGNPTEGRLQASRQSQRTKGKRHMLRGAGLVAISSILWASLAFAENAPGVTATEIKVGGTFPFSGPVSSVGTTGKGLLAYITYLNERGGVGGRKVNYIALDDAYSPPKAVEQIRRLVESDEIAFLFSQLGTPSTAATAKYLAARKVPSIAILSGANAFTQYRDYPYITTALPSFDTEGRIYAKYLKKELLPNAKIAILYQNDDLGKGYVAAFKAVFGDDFARRTVVASYELSEPTIESHIVNFKSAQVEALFIAGTGKFAAQAIRRSREIGWKPLTIINLPSGSTGGTIVPAGVENSIGVVSGTYSKDPNDPKWANDRDMANYRAIFAKYLSGADIADTGYLIGYRQGMLLEQLLKQCGDDLSRENILKQARNFKDLVLPTTLPGIKVNTNETNSKAWTQLQLQRWTGSTWELFGEVLDGDSN
jgi:branched-chain amino acid transport system substrate-binding protein